MCTLKSVVTSILSAVILAWSNISAAQDLEQIKASGVLRHIGVPYANFVTGSGDGMDVELVKLFAQHLGVRYEYVQSTWTNIIGDLTGRRAKSKGTDVEFLEEMPIKGDMIANGFTVLPWREKAIDFSTPTFPTQVWLITRSDFAMTPIVPTGDVTKDILATKAKLAGEKMLSIPNTCLDPALYQFEKENVQVATFPGNLNEVAPAVINKEAETSILDVPDALVALEKWPGQIKVIGPISQKQVMASAFRKDSPNLREAYNAFLEQCKKDGTYLRLVKKYYPAVVDYYSEFFADAKE